MPKKPVSIENNFWVAHDGYATIDEDNDFSEVDKVRWQDPDVKALIKEWRALKRRVIEARYGGIEAYATLDRGEEESYTFLKICFFHPGPDLDTPLPRKKVATIKKRVKALMGLIQKQGFELEPLDWEALEEDDALSEYWVTLRSPDEFGPLLDSLVQLSIEFGLLEYLWQPEEE